MGRLQGKIAVVTGAGAGIGAAIAKMFVEEGASIVAADISGKQEALAERLGANCVPVRADVSKSADIQAMLALAVEKFGRIDILINNAGIDGFISPTADYPEESFDQVIAVNLKSVFLGMKYAIPIMIKTGGGSIVNTASMAGMVAFPNMPAYCASKGGVLMLTKTAAMEYVKQGIRVNAICPGAIRTEISDSLPPELIKGVVDATPMGRFADASEVARLAVFLGSEDSSFITGTHVLIDGGYTSL